MAYTDVNTYTKPHSSGEGGGKTVVINAGVNPQNLKVVNLSAHNADIVNLEAADIKSNNGQFNYIESIDCNVSYIEGNSLNYVNGNINSLINDNISTNKITVKDEANIQNLIAKYIQSENITTDNLTVNKSAHFFELIIDKIRSVQGTQINTAANCIVDYVEAYEFDTPDDIKIDDLEDIQNIDYYRIYWRCTDNDGREVSNDWLPLDLALCESFSVNTGVSYDVSNKYYWRKVIATDEGNKKYINFNTGEISDTDPGTYAIQFSTFEYGDSADPSTYFDDFTITSQVTGEWDDVDTFTPSSTLYGLVLTPNTDDDFFGGNIIFTTDKLTKLNFSVYYDDGSFMYFPADIYTSSYNVNLDSTYQSITTSGTTETVYRNITKIIINTAVIDQWELCNWIDLSNDDMDGPKLQKSTIPSAGDNVCQLGYRYDELPNPTQTDISRASAIIIAAYETPDSGITPPSYAQYKDIGTNPLHRWDLGYYRHSYFDADNAYFEGSFAVNAAGQTMSLDDYINDKVNNNPVRVSIQNNGYDFDLCVLQCQKDQLGNLYIDGMNNFPTSIDLKLSGYSDPRYINVLAATLTLFGRTLNLIDIYSHQASDTAQGIYVSSVTMPGVDYIHITFGYRGTATQQIDAGTALSFAGQFRVGEDQGGTIVYTDYSVTKSVSIAAVTTAQGANGELWLLNKECEAAHVNNQGKYECLLRYGIQHIIGSTGTIGVPTTEKLKITHYDALNTPVRVDVLTSSHWDSTNNRWEYSWDIDDWYGGNTQPTYIRVEFLDSNDNILDTSVVNIMIDTTALFTVQEGLMESIQAVATGAYNQYSVLSQTVSGIDARVTSQQTSINNITGEITGINTSISDLNVGVGQISASVTNVTNDLNTLEEDIQRTGIDIEQGKITLTAENTDIQGNLNIHNANEGLVIYDNATDTPKIAIVGEELSSIDNGASAPIAIYGSTTLNNNATTYVFGNGGSDQTSLGILASGNKIVLQNFQISIFDYMHQVVGMNYTINITCNDTTVYTSANAEMTRDSQASVTSSIWVGTPNINYTVTTAGEYKMYFTINLYPGQESALCYLSTVCNVVPDSLLKIGKDAVKFLVDNYKLFWIGPDRMQLRWGTNYLDFVTLNEGLDSHTIVYGIKGNGGYGTQYYAEGEIGSMMKCRRINNGESEAVLTKYDGLVTIGTNITTTTKRIANRDNYSGFFVTVPNPSGNIAGKKFYIKNYSSTDNCYLITENHMDRIMNSNDEGHSYIRNIGDDSITLICDGYYWINFS